MQNGLPSLQAFTADVSSQEIEKAFEFCVKIIDNPPEEYRIVKQAVLGLVHLSARRSDLRPRALLKILQVVRDATLYRSNPRRYAVHSIGCMTYFDEKLIGPATELLVELLKPRIENSQYVRKAAFVGLSRIGRRYPYFQNVLIPLFFQHYKDPATKESVRWGIVIGLGRMSQSNPSLRDEFSKEMIHLCSNKAFRMRWAGIKALGHACCPIGDVETDTKLSNTTFELATGLLRHGGVEEIKKSLEKDPTTQLSDEAWKNEHVYLVQYAATQSLGLLLRSDPDKWWPKISPVFGSLLLNPNIASMIKAIIMICYGKISYFMPQDSPYYKAIKDILFELCSNENILVSEPATYGLVNMSLSHQELYPEVKALVTAKLGGGLENANNFQLQYYLKTWCKMVAKDYQPILNLCSKAISQGSSPFIANASNGTSTSSQIASTFNQTTMVGLESEGDEKRDSKRNSIGSSGTPKSQEIVPMDVIRPIARDNRRLNELCSLFSTSVIESIVMLVTDSSNVDDREFLDNLKALIIKYSRPTESGTKPKPDQQGMTDQCIELFNLDTSLREAATSILKFPEILDNRLWLSNLKMTIFNAASARAYEQLAKAEKKESTAQLSYSNYKGSATQVSNSLQSQLDHLKSILNNSGYSLDSNIGKGTSQYLPQQGFKPSPAPSTSQYPAYAPIASAPSIGTSVPHNYPDHSVQSRAHLYTSPPVMQQPQSYQTSAPIVYNPPSYPNLTSPAFLQQTTYPQNPSHAHQYPTQQYPPQYQQPTYLPQSQQYYASHPQQSHLAQQPHSIQPQHSHHIQPQQSHHVQAQPHPHHVQPQQPMQYYNNTNHSNHGWYEPPPKRPRYQ